MVPGLIVLIDLQLRTLSRRGLNYLDHDGPIIGLLLLRLVFRRLWNQGIKTAWGEWRDDHEDDQQHEKHVDQWSYIDICGGTTTVIPNCHCHIKSSKQFRRTAAEAEIYSPPAVPVAPGAVLRSASGCRCSVRRPS